MKFQSVFLTLFVISLQIFKSFQDCRIINDAYGASNYFCNTIQDLEKQGNPYALNVTVSNGKLPLSLLNLKPTLSVTLSENVVLSNEIFGRIKDLLEVWNQTRELATLTISTFGNQPLALKSLQIDRGNIKNIEPGTFSQMIELIEIYIVNNDLRSVSNGVFNDLNLETLALSNNKIRRIERGALSNMKNLKHLYLNGNLISNFQSETLMNHRNQLETLHLQKNSIRVIDPNTFKGLDSLRVLNLSNNRIDNIVNYSFDELLSLESLALANNFLRNLNAEIFPLNAFPDLLQLNIANNRLSYLTTRALEKIKTVRYISIAGNPWKCPCLNILLTWIGNQNINHVCDGDYFKGNRPVCVVGKVNLHKCEYSDNNQDVNIFAEENNYFRNTEDCFI